MSKLKINLIYFSCGRDEKLLNLSIESSRKQYEFNSIFIFSDPNDPIKSVPKSTVVIPRESGSEKLYGLENIKDMHNNMKMASEGCDYILKKDSDVLDCSRLAYAALEKGGWDCYGALPMARPSLIPDGHFNGNAYFLKSEIVRNLPSQFPDSVHDWRVLNYPEDMVTSSMVKKLTKKTKIEGTAQNGGGNYLFDIFLSDVAAKDKGEVTKYGFAHCRSNFRVMDYLWHKIKD